jgi:hypothetical protein
MELPIQFPIVCHYAYHISPYDIGLLWNLFRKNTSRQRRECDRYYSLKRTRLDEKLRNLYQRAFERIFKFYVKQDKYRRLRFVIGREYDDWRNVFLIDKPLSEQDDDHFYLTECETFIEELKSINDNFKHTRLNWRWIYIELL